MRLDLDVTFAAICSAARAHAYLSFGDVAFANEARWTAVRRHMGRHLKGVCAVALHDGGPLVSSIVVNQRHRGTGAMADETLAGFLTAARDLGLAWDDGRAFLREQQDATFRWAERTLSNDPLETGCDADIGLRHPDRAGARRFRSGSLAEPLGTAALDRTPGRAG